GATQQGGTVEHNFQFYTAEHVDAEIIGELGILKSLERDIELTAPEIISQQKKMPIEPETPEQALAKTQGNGTPAADDKAPAGGDDVKRRLAVPHHRPRRENSPHGHHEDEPQGRGLTTPAHAA